MSSEVPRASKRTRTQRTFYDDSGIPSSYSSKEEKAAYLAKKQKRADVCPVVVPVAPWTDRHVEDLLRELEQGNYGTAWSAAKILWQCLLKNEEGLHDKVRAAKGPERILKLIVDETNRPGMTRKAPDDDLFDENVPLTFFQKRKMCTNFCGDLLTVLHFFVHGNKEMSRALIDAGGIQTMVRVLRMGDDRAKSVAAAVLDFLAEAEQGRQAQGLHAHIMETHGVIPLLIHLIEATHEEDGPRNAACALISIVDALPPLAEKVVELGAIPIIVEFILKGDNYHNKLAGSEFLQALCEADNKHEAEILKLGVVRRELSEAQKAAGWNGKFCMPDDTDF